MLHCRGQHGQDVVVRVAHGRSKAQAPVRARRPMAVPHLAFAKSA